MDEWKCSLFSCGTFTLSDLNVFAFAAHLNKYEFICWNVNKTGDQTGAEYLQWSFVAPAHRSVT